MLRMFENRALRRMCGFKRDEATGGGEEYIRGNLMICTAHLMICTAHLMICIARLMICTAHLMICTAHQISFG
jgi:hypothetical protein